MSCSRALRRALLTVLIAPLPIQAAEWSAEPGISLRSGYNDNIRLTAQDHDSVWETALTPTLRLGIAEENRGIHGFASASVRRFAGGSGRERSSLLDREDYNLRTNAYHRTERDEYSAFLAYTRDSTLDSELDEFGEVVEDLATRTRYSFAPNWSHSLDERTWLTLGYNLSVIDYSENSGSASLIPYDYDVFTASLTRQLTPRLMGTLTSSYARYRPDTDLDSDTASLQAGLTRELSETLTVSLLGGIRNTTADTLTQTGYCVYADQGSSFPECTNGIAIATGTRKDETDNNGSVFSAQVTKLLETGKLTGSLSRTTNPSSQGELLDSTRLIINGEHKLAERLISRLSLEYTNTETLVNTYGGQAKRDEDLFRIRPRLIWRWLREMELAAEYEYAQNDYNRSNTDTATRNAFYLTLTYTPPKISR